MNRTEFHRLLEHPENAGKISLSETEKAISEFPYWQSARLLYLKALQQKQHFSFESQLKLTAIYAGDRSKLFDLINNYQYFNDDEVKLPAAHHQNYNTEIQVEKVTAGLITDIESPVNTVEQNPEQFSAGTSDNLTSELNDQKTALNDENSGTGFIHDTKNENDLSKLIEQRINELQQQNISYGEISTHVTSNEIKVENPTQLVDENIDLPVIEEPKTKFAAEDESTTIKEEIESLDVYEETSIAADIFNDHASINNEKEFPATIENDQIIADTEATLTELDEKSTEAGKITDLKTGITGLGQESNIEVEKTADNAPQHSFVEWFKFLKPIEAKKENEKETIQLTDSVNAVIAQETLIYDIEKAELPETADELKNSGVSVTEIKPQTEIINRFIEEEPRIQPKKTAFYSPSVAARKSVIYDENFVSETLAEIFYNQQLFDKAILAYEKLTLMFPEKSTLFAARIQKIKEESKSGK